MEEIHKKIEDYVENVEGPFFCIMGGEGDRIEICKNITLEEITFNCLDGIWEMQKTRKPDVAAYAGFLFIYVFAFAKMHNVKIREEDRLAIRNTALHIFEDCDSADSPSETVLQ